MSTLSPDMTVAEIAARLPGSVRVFEKHRIDFCCGGKLPVTDACKARGLDASAVMAEIEQTMAEAAPAADAGWQSAPLDKLVDHIVAAHHAFLKSQLPRIAERLDKVLTAHSQRHGAMLRPLIETFAAMRDELDSHLMKEELILFPLIRSLESETGGEARFHCGSVRNPIRVMVMEHDLAGTALARMRELTSGYTAPADACNTFRAAYHELAELERDLHVHIHLENNILFPRAVDLESRAA
jgi:regulator of cell morphogenesis and NO signaling